MQFGRVAFFKLILLFGVSWQPAFASALLQGTTLAAAYNIKTDFGAKGDGTTDDTEALNSAVNSCSNSGCSIYFPNGTYKITSTIKITKSISLRGESKKNTLLEGFGLGKGVPIFTYDCKSEARCESIEISNIQFHSDNNLADGLSLHWVIKSSFDNLYFYNLRNGLNCNSSFSNKVSNSSVFNLTGTVYLLEANCNDFEIGTSQIGSSSFGVQITGTLQGLRLMSIDCEDIATSGACVDIAPTTGYITSGIAIEHGYIEGIRGTFLRIRGEDKCSTQNLTVTGNYISGGYNSMFSEHPGWALHAIWLRNVCGFDISNNFVHDWKGSFIKRNGSERNGSLSDNNLNVTKGQTAIKLSDAPFADSVIRRNNRSCVDNQICSYVDRQEQFASAMPTRGTFAPGDIVWNRTPIAKGTSGNRYVVLGWFRATTGSGNVLGTDWFEMRSAIEKTSADKSTTANPIQAAIRAASGNFETLQVNTSVFAGQGMQHKRISTGVLAPNSTTSVSLTWTVPFSDSNYTLSCALVDTSGANLQIFNIPEQSSSGLLVNLKNVDPEFAHSGTLGCIAMHD